MRFYTYIKYFYFLASRWNLRIAWHIMWKEVNGEKKYGIQTTGADELNQLEDLGIDTSYATIYIPASYDLLEAVFTELMQKKLAHFIDIGCGKGRVLCVAAHFGFKNITGIDFSKELCDQAKINLEKTKNLIPDISYKIINNDAFYYEIPGDADCIFFFNPFDEIIMEGVIENINTSLEEYPRDIYIIYFTPLYKLQFIENGFKEVFYYKKLTFLECSILKKEMTSF